MPVLPVVVSQAHDLLLPVLVPDHYTDYHLDDGDDDGDDDVIMMTM